MELSTSPLIWQAKSRNVPPPKCYTQTLLSAKTPRSTTGSSVAFQLIGTSNTMLYNLRRVKQWKNAWEPSRSRRHHRGGIFWLLHCHRNQMGGHPPIVPNKIFLQGFVSGPEQVKPAHPPPYRSVLLVTHFTIHGRRCMQPGSWMIPSTMEADRAILRPLCVSSRPVAWHLDGTFGKEE